MSKVLQNAPREHSAILLTFIKLPVVIKTFVLSIFEWPFYTGFTAHVLAHASYIEETMLSVYAKTVLNGHMCF